MELLLKNKARLLYVKVCVFYLWKWGFVVGDLC